MSELTKEEIVQRIEQTPYDAAQALQGLADALRNLPLDFLDENWKEEADQARAALKAAKPFLKKETT